MRHLPSICLLALVTALSASPSAAQATGAPSTELDGFMADVLAHRDENWRKLQQYVLDERERAELTGPGGVRLYGLARDYTWYIRDGVFVRSPVRFDGVTLSEEERQKYEREWLQREANRARSGHDADPPPSSASGGEGDAAALARLTREPQFVSMAYFLKFKFEPGHYAFAGREDYDGHEVYRIEYYPSRLFADDEKAAGDAASDKEQDTDDRIERQMNKVALVTLWVEPSSRQVLRYAFTNMGLDFMPGRWLVRVDDLQASMRMIEAFPGVWLPRDIAGEGRITLASGSYAFEYRTSYEHYREATVKARIR